MTELAEIGDTFGHSIPTDRIDRVSRNDSIETATDLGDRTDIALVSLTVSDEGNDVDWYRWHATADGTLRLSIANYPTAGVLKIELFDQAGSFVVASETTELGT